MLGAIALFALGACSPDVPDARPDQAAPVSGIDLSAMDQGVRPGEDFFAYVNGTWVGATDMPADKSRYGVFDQLRDESQEAVRAIIEESATGDFAHGSDEQKVGDLYKSFLDWETRDALGIEPLQPELDRIDAIADYDDLAVYFAETMKRGLDAPLGAGQVADFLDPSRYAMIVSQSGLGLPDREYYFKDDGKSEEIRVKYVEHIARMFDLAGFDGGSAAAGTIMALETRLAAENMTKEKARDYANNYKKYTQDDLRALMPGFNWDGYLGELGIGDIEELVVYTRDYAAALDGIIADTDLETWKTYLRWSALNQSASRLTQALDQQNFEFYEKTLSGVEEQREDWRRATRVVDSILGEVVGRVYVKRHFPPEAKERMLELVGNLVRAYEKSINQLDWMTDATKVQALDKLSKFTPMIGYPDEWRDYSVLSVAADDLYGNLERASLAEYQRHLDRRNDPVDRLEWHMNPQTVNAYYNPPMNQIVFPAAILQPPFFNMAADDAVNYGAIGAVIGHEIGHGFDDKGSTFDGDGVLRDWWTDQDRSEFEKRTGALIEQYDAFMPFEDLSVNGEFTQGENIGDLGGITIGLLAYKMSREGKDEPPVIDGFTGIQRVFLGYGQVWRGIIRDEELRRRIAIDPHSPAVYRTNGPVRNVPEWYEAFQVAETDALYLPPEERVKIW
ncbi:MAG: peptidase M13 [Woeseiaceae bacterium]|nr:peptidase M13 [Gammaproteobacteria bacterium]NNK24149.1 peptidase M13 [Woeseiaceae bacterium]